MYFSRFVCETEQKENRKEKRDAKNQQITTHVLPSPRSSFIKQPANVQQGKITFYRIFPQPHHLEPSDHLVFFDFPTNEKKENKRKDD